MKKMWAYGLDTETLSILSKKPLDERKPSMGIKKLSVPIPNLMPDEVLVEVYASALNYNSIWSSLAHPVSPFQLINSHVKRNPCNKDHIQPFAIYGSDASGVIKKVGSSVTSWKEGDEVLIHCNVVDMNDPLSHQDSMLSSTQSIWGYETNYGAFAEYTKVRSDQLIKKPNHVSWETAASFSLTLSTAYRMLISDNGANIKTGQTCLIWGGSGGLGSFAIQLCKLAGVKSIAVVSSEKKAEICKKLGADFVINRKSKNIIDFLDKDGNPNLLGWRRFMQTIKKMGCDPIDVVFEHVGSNTLGLSVFLAKRGGKVVVCGASSGFNATIDLRYLWMELKSIIGSHFANYDEATKAANLVFSNQIKPLIYSINPIKELPKLADQMFDDETNGKIVFNHKNTKF